MFTRTYRRYTSTTAAAEAAIMSTTDAAQDYQPRDLTFVLTDLEDRADRVLTSLYLLWQLDTEFEAIETSIRRQDYVDLIRSHTEKMEANLEVMERKSELLDDDSVYGWINGSSDSMEKADREKQVEKLAKKMDCLQRQMAEARRGYVG
jgi:hypothetical protein